MSKRKLRAEISRWDMGRNREEERLRSRAWKAEVEQSNFRSLVSTGVLKCSGGGLKQGSAV